MGPAWWTTTTVTASVATMDTYGFPLSGLTEADQATRQRALARDRKVAKDWDPKALPTWQPDLSVPSSVPRKLKLLVRKGIPQELRPKLWLQFSGGLALRSHSPEGHYQALLAAAPKLAKSSLLQLDSATAKTFPGLKLLATESGREAVRRLAHAYSQHTHKASLLGDSALLSLAAFLLAVVGLEREEDAFWTLVGLVETRLSSLALLQGESYSGLEAKVLETIAVKKCPRLASLLSLLDMPFQSLLRHWLPTLFTQCLPAETAVRVWDVLLVEESPACFRIGVALIKMNEPALVTSCRSGLVDRSLSWRIAHTFDADALFKMAFGTVLPLVGMDELAAARADAQRVYEADLAARQARLGSLFRQPSFPPMELRKASKSESRTWRPLAVLEPNKSPAIENIEIQRVDASEETKHSAGKVQVDVESQQPMLLDRADKGKRPANDSVQLGSFRRNSSSAQQAAAMFF